MISKSNQKNPNPKIAISALGLTISTLELLEFDDLSLGLMILALERLRFDDLGTEAWIC